MSTMHVGAYGFRLVGLPDAEPWLLEAPDHWPTVAVSKSRSSRVAAPGVHEDVAEVPLVGGGHLRVTRDPLTVTFYSPSRELSTAEIIHPLLAPAASVLASWHGLIPLHAGAVLIDGRAWIVTGDREAGKSSTLAEMARRGFGVMADDLVVLRGSDVNAGPRSLDLRSADEMGAAEDLGIVGQRRRWRIPLSPVPVEVPVAGLVQLHWASSPTLRHVDMEERNEISFPAASLRLDRRQVLQVLALDTFALGRPKSGVEETADLLVGLIESAEGP
jgi:hypothetical protein